MIILKRFKSIEVKRFITHNNITQKFTLPAASWVGFSKRLVKSVKLLAKPLLFYEEMETVLCDVESILNSRPLFYSSGDFNGEWVESKN